MRFEWLSALRLLEGGELAPELLEHLLAVARLALGFLRVRADHVALPPLAFADDDLLHAQVLGHHLVAAGAGEYLARDLVAGAHARGQDVLAAAERERSPVLLRVHPGIAHEDAAPEPPAAQVVLHLLHRGDVGGLAREDPGAHRQPVARHRQSHHDLRGVTAPVLRVAALAQRRVLPPPRELVAAQGDPVLLVHLEVQAGRVVEDEVHVRLHEVGGAEEDLLLHLLLVRLEEVHRAVEVLQLERLLAGEEHLFPEPLLPAVELGVRPCVRFATMAKSARSKGWRVPCRRVRSAITLSIPSSRQIASTAWIAP